MSFQDKLKDLRSDKELAIYSIDNIEEIKKEEIKELTRNIEDKYNSKKENYENEFKNAVNDIKEYCKKIEEYSEFSIYDMRFLLADLISVFEGKNYIPYEMAYHPHTGSPAQVQDILVIIEESLIENIHNTNYLTERYLNHLLKYNKIIMLDDNYSSSKSYTLKFYKFTTGTINQNISLKGYNYVKEYIDFVINYRLENKKDIITGEELEKLKNQFIIMNQEHIERQYQINAEKDIESYTDQVEQNLEHNRKLLKRRINKIENK